MRTTLNLNEELIEKARKYTRQLDKTKLLHMGLELLIRQEAAKQLANLGASMPNLQLSSLKRLYKKSPTS